MDRTQVTRLRGSSRNHPGIASLLVDCSSPLLLASGGRQESERQTAHAFSERPSLFGSARYPEWTDHLLRYVFLWLLFLLSVSAVARPNQDRLQPPLKSEKELEAWRDDPKRPKVRLHPLPLVASPVEPVLIPVDERHILDLIACLADVADPDYGISPTMSGQSFAPVSGSARAGTLLLTSHNFKQSQAVLELVKLGPRALPFLLRHLKDATPTKLTIKNRLGVMEYRHEIGFNEANPVERKYWRKAPVGLSSPFEHPLETYQVKVGDICFSIIGQIVGRRYLAVRYQPTAVVIINSPIADVSLAREVQAVWRSTAPTQHLFHSLLTDYSCRGVYNGMSFDGWGTGSNLQCEAATRLLYYFPGETAALIASRLEHLKVWHTGPTGANMTDKEDALWRKRELSNGVDTAAFVKATSWCPDPRIQAQMVGIVKHAGDADVMAAAVRGVPLSKRKSLTPCIQRFLLARPSSNDTWNYEAYLVLKALADYWGGDAKPLFVTYMRKRGPVRLNTVCAALRDSKTDWDRSILVRLLSDRRTIPGDGHWTNPKGEGPQVLTRVCDAAAQALATWRQHLKFDMDQSRSKLDKEIATIKARVRN